MATCFVIQPFDGGKFDKRFEDTFSPAIIESGVEPYRVDRDPRVEVPIQAIEEGIKSAAICLADITTNNPNVWYELGYAFAAGKPVLMVCSDERKEIKFPFDIQHRTVITYQSESVSDFEKLKTDIVKRMKALLKRSQQLRQLAENDRVAPREGLTQPELAVIFAVSGESIFPGDFASVYSLKREVEAAGFNSLGFALGLRRLIQKDFLETHSEEDNDGPFQVVSLTDKGWDWIGENENMFELKIHSRVKEELDDDIPF